MGQTRQEITTNLTERLCWEAVRRDDSRVARRLYRKQVADGVYRLDEGALLDDFFYFLHKLGAIDWLDQGPAAPSGGFDAGRAGLIAQRRVLWPVSHRLFCPRRQKLRRLWRKAAWESPLVCLKPHRRSNHRA
jgi:hypothetical protein